MSASELPNQPTGRQIPTPLRLLLVLFLLFGFLVAIKMLGGSIGLMGTDTVRTIFDGVSNPFAGLAAGVLFTVLVQSSSMTTSTIVQLVGTAKNPLPLRSAVPMIMGANIGTTVTNTLVSIGHVRRSREFVRAFAAATMHDFFNLMCVALFLPLEMATHMLEKSATSMTSLLTGGPGGEYKSPIKSAVKTCYKGVMSFLSDLGLEGLPLALAMLVMGIVLTFFCLLFITKNMRVMFAGNLERALNRTLGKSGLLGIGIGIVMTVAVQSSSITTSLLVPMCAAGILRLDNAFPIMLGANIGTTVTALLASMAASHPAGLTIALVHLQFNLLGVAVFYPIPALRRIPIRLALRLALASSKSPLWILVYVLGVFILLPLLGYWLF